MNNGKSPDKKRQEKMEGKETSKSSVIDREATPKSDNNIRSYNWQSTYKVSNNSSTPEGHLSSG